MLLVVLSLLRRVGNDPHHPRVRAMTRTLYPVMAQMRDASRALAIDYYLGQRSLATTDTGFRPVVAPHYEPAALETELARTLVTPAAEANTAAAMVRHVEQAGRDTIVDNVRADPIGTRWARVPTGRETCAWCTMQVSRGPVFAKESFKSHARCDCIASPVFEGQRDWEGKDAYERARKLWQSSTEGYGGKDAINAFRRAHESDTRTTARNP